MQHTEMLLRGMQQMLVTELELANTLYGNQERGENSLSWEQFRNQSWLWNVREALIGKVWGSFRSEWRCNIPRTNDSPNPLQIKLVQSSWSTSHPYWARRFSGEDYPRKKACRIHCAKGCDVTWYGGETTKFR